MARDSNKSSTVLRSFTVLEHVARCEAPPTASQLSSSIGMDRVTCYRMLRTIEDAGYLVCDPDTKTYRLSRKILSLAQSVLANEVDRERIDKTLKSISSRTGETCHYSVLEGSETILMQRAKGTQLVAVDFQIGTRCELHATSIGKAILANQSETFIQEYLGRNDLIGYTERTLTDPRNLNQELVKIKEQGVAFDMEELSSGMNCVAVPIHEIDGSVTGGISISGPITRFTSAQLKVLAAIIKDEIWKMETSSL